MTVSSGNDTVSTLVSIGDVAPLWNQQRNVALVLGDRSDRKVDKSRLLTALHLYFIPDELASCGAINSISQLLLGGLVPLPPLYLPKRPADDFLSAEIREFESCLVCFKNCSVGI